MEEEVCNYVLKLAFKLYILFSVFFFLWFICFFIFLFQSLNILNIFKIFLLSLSHTSPFHYFFLQRDAAQSIDESLISRFHGRPVYMYSWWKKGSVNQKSTMIEKLNIKIEIINLRLRYLLIPLLLLRNFLPT